VVNFLLDTNVLSDVWRSDATPEVRETISRYLADQLFVSVASIGEIQKGLELLLEGRRKRQLTIWSRELQTLFAPRILPIDLDTAIIWGDITARTKRDGHNLGVMDVLIAATAVRHDLVVMTRNVKDFQPTGVPILNPWTVDLLPDS